jgi:type II secretory pathway predicted ATPase ExeA
MMFEGIYGFRMNPFDKHYVLEKDGFPSNDHTQAVARLNYLKDIRGIGVLTSRPGAGKSFALRCFAKDLNPGLFEMAYICLSTISVTEFYSQLCGILNLEPSNKKSRMFKQIQERLYYLYKEKKKPLILAIDEAQELNTSILKDLKMIMNHSYDSVNCFALVLAGEPYLNNILERPVHEALRQRITVHYNYEGLSDDEVSKYIAHKFQLAGAPISILGDGTLSAICGHCQGNPRLIDNLMNDALTLGAQLQMQSLDAEIIMAAINNQALH